MRIKSLIYSTMPVMPAQAGIQTSGAKQTSLFTSTSLTNRSRTLLTSFVLTRLDASLRWHDVL